MKLTGILATSLAFAASVFAFPVDEDDASLSLLRARAPALDLNDLLRRDLNFHARDAIVEAPHLEARHASADALVEALAGLLIERRAAAPPKPAAGKPSGGKPSGGNRAGGGGGGGGGAGGDQGYQRLVAVHPNLAIGRHVFTATTPPKANDNSALAPYCARRGYKHERMLVVEVTAAHTTRGSLFDIAFKEGKGTGQNAPVTVAREAWNPNLGSTLVYVYKGTTTKSDASISQFGKWPFISFFTSSPLFGGCT